MQYRKFGNTGLIVSEIGFGAWAIGGGAMIGDTAIGWGDVNDAHSALAIEAAIEAGITFFDTADIYGLGHSESILGTALAHHQDAMIATKVGNVARNGQFTTDYSKEHILTACEESLKRLKRDTIDYYQLHTVKRAQLEEGSCVEAMQLPHVQKVLEANGISTDNNGLEEIISLVKDRCTFLPDFYEHTVYFFKAPHTLDVASVKPKWTELKESFFQNFIQELESLPEWSAAFIENGFKTIASVCNIKPGELQLPFRIMLVGGKFGPPVFDIAAIIGKEETVSRIRFALPLFKAD